MIIRPARGDEAGEVADLFNGLAGHGPVVTMTGDHARRHLLGPRPLSMLRVAEHEGRLAGFVTGNIVFDSTRAAGGCIVAGLYVRPDGRRRGIGRALMAALTAETRRQGAIRLWWDDATAFYTSLGAVPEERFEGRLLADAAYHALAAEADA